MLFLFAKHSRAFTPTSTLRRSNNLSNLSNQYISSFHHCYNKHLLNLRSSSSSSKVTLLQQQQQQQQQSQESMIVPIKNMKDMFDNGGDYAGQSATFSPITGKIIPVPEHYVPESMVEWGQIPSCLEVIVSEDLMQDVNEDDDDYSNSNSSNSSNSSSSSSSSSSSKMTLQRNTVQVMPEVGCGLDNLDTMKVQENIPSSLLPPSSSAAGIHIPSLAMSVSSVYIQDKQRFESIFTTTTYTEQEKEEDNKKDCERIRISVNFFPNKLALKSPITYVKERKTSNTSTQGKIADGGGLCARTITKLIGKDDMNHPFSNRKKEEEENKSEFLQLMIGSWNRYEYGNVNDDNKINIVQMEYDEKDWTNNNDNNDDDETNPMKILSLPLNVMIRYGGESQFILEVSVIVNREAKDDAEQLTGRIIVKSEFQQDKDGNISAKSTNYAWEEKI